jgi:hypothetical protein
MTSKRLQVGVDTARESHGEWSSRLVSLTALVMVMLLAAIVALAALVADIAGPVPGIVSGAALTALAWAGVRPWLP